MKTFKKFLKYLFLTVFILFTILIIIGIYFDTEDLQFNREMEKRISKLELSLNDTIFKLDNDRFLKLSSSYEDSLNLYVRLSNEVEFSEQNKNIFNDLINSSREKLEMKRNEIKKEEEERLKKEEEQRKKDEEERKKKYLAEKKKRDREQIRKKKYNSVCKKEVHKNTIIQSQFYLNGRKIFGAIYEFEMDKISECKFISAVTYTDLRGNYNQAGFRTSVNPKNNKIKLEMYNQSSNSWYSPVYIDPATN